MPIPSPTQILALFILGWAAWKVLRRFVRKDPLSVIPGPPSRSFLVGNIKDLLSPSSWDYHDALAETYGSVFRITGLFSESILYVYDTKALYNIFVKDTDTFDESEDFIRRNIKIFGMGLISTKGEQHRKQRKMLNPVFSISHMRTITPIVFDVVHKLERSLSRQVAGAEKEINLNSWTTRTALELIGQVGFGYSFDSLEPDAPEHPFAMSLKDLPSTVNDFPIRLARLVLFPHVFNLGSSSFQRTVVDLLPWKKLHQIRDMVDVLHRNSLQIFEATKRSLKEGHRGADGRIGEGKDIMSVLVKANMSAREEDRLADEELIAQISVLTFAGMDTTSNGISRVLHLLSEAPEVQARLRQELTEAHEKRGGEDPTYDELNALPFLDAVCKETLRVYAPAPFTIREAKKDGVLPFATPVKTTDGRSITELFIPKGASIFVSMRHCNKNPEIWGPDAAEWKPERWLSPLPETVAKAKVPGVYANLMTFIGGHRACIGFKFSELEMKVVLSLLVKSFHIAPSSKKVVWLWHGVAQPTTEDAPTNSTGTKELQLPLILRRV